MASLARTNGVPSDQPQGAYYTVDIAQSGLLAGTGDNYGGGVNQKQLENQLTVQSQQHLY